MQGVNVGICFSLVSCESSIHRFCEGLDHCGEINDFDVFRAVRPIVSPTDNHVATIGGMPVIAEIPTLKFKFDPNSLPPARCNLALCLAIRVPGLESLDHITQFLRDDSKEKNYALFVNRLVSEAAEI